jgi:hypothetical protein
LFHSLLFHFSVFHFSPPKTFSLTEIHETTQSAWIDGSRAWINAATTQGTFNSSPRT